MTRRMTPRGFVDLRVRGEDAHRVRERASKTSFAPAARSDDVVIPITSERDECEGLAAG